MKMFGFFQKKIEKTNNAIKINDNYASIVRESNNSSIENARDSMNIMKKAKKAKKIENREDVALKFGAFRRNVINLFKYDNEKISDQDMRKSIIKKYDAKRVKAGIAKYDENGNADMDKTVEWTAENNSRKELNSSIRAEKKVIWGSRVGLVKNEIKRIHIDNKLQRRKDRFMALGIVTSPLKYATDGVVHGAKTADAWLGKNIKHYKGGKNFAKNCVKSIFGNKEAQESVKDTFNRKAEAARRAVGDTITAVRTTAQVTEKYFNIRREQRKAAWEAAKDSITENNIKKQVSTR